MGSIRKKQRITEEKPSSRLAKRKEVGRGPTKREMREDALKSKSKEGKNNHLSNEKDKKESKNKNTKPKKQTDKSMLTDKASSLLDAESKNKIRNRLRVEKRKIDRKNKAVANKENSLSVKGKVMYTEENINTFLLDGKDGALSNKTVNMLLFLFRTFKNRPEELLAKIKILTTGKKVEDDDNIHVLVLNHLFKYLNMKKDFKGSLFTLIEENTLLSKYVAEFLFSTAHENTKYDYYFSILCEELASKLEKGAALSFDEYAGCVDEIDGYENVETYVKTVAKAMSDDNVENKPTEEAINNELVGDNKATDKASNKTSDSDKASDSEMEDDLVEKNRVEDDSSVSLVSLNDDQEIERIDRQLGEMFRKSTVSVVDERSAINIIKCIELLITHNYAVKADNISKIFYFIQFNSTSKLAKFIIRDILSKINEQKRVFKIYHICTLILPECHQLFNIFYNYCGDAFNLRSLMDSVFKFGYQDFLVTKVGLEKYCQIYDSTLDASFDEFLITLIQSETQVDKLKNLQGQYFKPEIQEVITESLKKFKGKGNE